MLKAKRERLVSKLELYLQSIRDIATQLRKENSCAAQYAADAAMALDQCAEELYLEGAGVPDASDAT